MTSTSPLGDRRRIEQLETASLQERPAPKATRGTQQKHIRIAVTVADDMDYYPPDGSNVFWIQFVDALAGKLPGLQTVGKTPRTASKEKHSAVSISGAYVPEGSLVAVFWEAPIGWTDSKAQWWILEAGSAGGTPVIRFEILAAGDCPGSVTDNRLPLGGRCWAKKLDRDGTTDNFVKVGDPFLVKDFRKDADGDPLPGEYIAAPGYRGVAALPEQVDDPDNEGETLTEWSIVDVEHVAEWIEGTLTEDMGDTTAGQSNSASVTSYSDGKNPGSTQNVYDPQGQFTRALSGAKYIARRNNKLGDGDPEDVTTLPKGRYELVECQSKAGWVIVTVTEDRSGTGVQQVTASILAYGGTQQDIQVPTDSTFHVKFRAGTYLYAKSGQKAQAIYDVVDDIYWIIDIEDREPITVVTDYRINPGLTKLQIKTRSVYITPAAAESDWIDKVDVGECPTE